MQDDWISANVDTPSEMLWRCINARANSFGVEEEGKPTAVCPMDGIQAMEIQMKVFTCL